MTESYATTTSETDWQSWHGETVTVRNDALTIASREGETGARDRTDVRSEGHVGRAVQRYDAGTPDTEWHRIRVRTSQPSPSTRVRLTYVAADDPLETSGGAVPFEAEGPSAPPETVETGDAGETVGGQDGGVAVETGRIGQEAESRDSTAVALLADTSGWTTLDVTEQADHLLSARGRYLYVGLELVGTDDSAPSVEQIRAFCARESIRRHLPDLYSDSAFLDDFLAVFETVFDDVEAEIDGLTRYLDPAGTPRQALSWLESWFGVDKTGGWPESARRELLARAPALFRKRGTKAGVRELVGLYLRHASGSEAATVFFFEPSDFECIDRPAVRDAVDAALPGTADVVCYYDSSAGTTASEEIESIVASETPAHVPTAVAPLEPSCSLDGATFLGRNSRLTRRQFALGETALHGNSTLDEPDYERSDQRARHHSERQRIHRGEQR